MDNQAETETETSPKTSKAHVYTIRDWKEYLGESLLIIFSVLLALILTEYINNLHEKENTKSSLKSIVEELDQNKVSIQEMNAYNLQVLKKIDSALVDKEIQQKIVSNDEFHLNVIAPQGALYRYLDDVAWTIAKENNIMSKIDVGTVSVLTKVYKDQNQLYKVEDEVAKVILNRDSRDPDKVHSTLILIRDIYHAWAVDRTPLLLQRIDEAKKKVESY